MTDLSPSGRRTAFVRLLFVVTVVALSAADVARPQTRGVELVALAPKKLAHCRKSELLRPACPRLVPRVRAAYLNHLAVEGRGTRFSLATFNLERGARDPDVPERNAPPRMAHLIVVGGHVERSAAGVFDDLRSARLSNGLLRRTRNRSLGFGTLRWVGRTGALFLAPSYPRGGMHGDHLIFRWHEGRRDYALSLHAWEPLTEAAATLRAVVASTDR
jgi:hypothetical protein